MTSRSDRPSLLREALAGVRPHMRRAALFSGIASLITLAPTLYMLQVYDRVVTSRSEVTLLTLTAAILGILVVMQMLEWARAAVMREAAVEFDGKVSSRLFDAVFAARIARRPGGSHQAFNDLRTIRDFFTSPIPPAVLEIPAALLMLVLVFMIHPALGWVTMFVALVQGALAIINERKTRRPMEEAGKSASEAQHYADSSLRNALVIESMGMYRDVHRRWLARQKEWTRQQAEGSDASGTYQAMTRMLQQVLSKALMGGTAFLIINDDFPGGGGLMIVVSVLGGRALTPIVQLVGQWRLVIGARSAWARLDTLLEGVAGAQEQMSLPAPAGKLLVEHLTAGAPGMTAPILRNVSFAGNPGEVIVVIGPSGSGKSTLARLMVGLWPALAGKVRLDGVDVATWNREEFGPHLGYLPQDVELLDGTIAENISRFGPGDPEALKSVIELVGLEGIVEQLPDGLETLVGEAFSNLSGGQKQRVALARALYGSPSFVVLDEPNSSLDDAGEAALVQAIARSKSKGSLVVVISHRRSILAVADKLLILRDGGVVAFGPRDEVMQKMGPPAARTVPRGAPQPRAVQIDARQAQANALPNMPRGD